MKRIFFWSIALLLAISLTTGQSIQAAPVKNATDTSGTVRDLISEGSYYYLMKDYANAVIPYSKALELEKKNPSLDKMTWRVLVDNLGVACGISGDLKKAKETFEYGISKDGEYPMFYYNLACTYAEMNDMDNAISFLRKAYKYRNNMMDGEPFPDPAKDDSFKRFMNNGRFLDSLNEMKAGEK
jgi:tetratricopeptide (TPR) repeat protein